MSRGRAHLPQPRAAHDRPARRPILELLDINKDTLLEVTTDGEALIIRRVKKAPLNDRALAAADRLMDAHEETYRKLAK